MPGNERNHDHGIGAAKLRVEDFRLLTGQGTFASDVTPTSACYAAMVRSPHAHAKICSIDVSIAAAQPGVLAVLTGADAAADGLGPIPHNVSWTGPPDAALRLPPGFDVFVTEHVPLPVERVRYVGEAVAMVIAETAAGAADAMEAVEVNYEELPAVTDARAAMVPGAARVWPACARNIALTCEVGDRGATERAFANAAHIVEFDGVVNRVTGSPMEPRAVIGEFDPADGRYTLRTASGSGVVRTRERLAEILGVELSQCRVVFGDMGGNFGTRNAFYPEFALVPWAAKKVGRSISWTATRLECFLSDYQARDLASRAELALDTDGNFLALRGVNTLNLGAYTVYFWPLRKGLSMMQGVYRIPCVHFQGHAVLTNTMPTAVYRSAGRPEAIYIIERLIDLAAEACGFDRVELRRRNLIDADAMPFTNGVGVTYDSGDYAAAMDRALAEADWAGFPTRRAEAASRGRARGIGIANYIEVTSGVPRERAELTVLEDGCVELAVGTMSSGQGHETSFAQLVSEWLGTPFDQ
ncbi:MAG: xanthine dehydrogenase family protein molybdopterin-binding subunit, partial [Gammaproteobacteria bacterium]|nr:xanthine dehydrogenase family protein molybdopterin-binding subunit [Gammaproteobacteria bacterium]